MKAIRVPFKFDDYGNVATSTSPSRIWAGRVRSVMGTATGQRVMRPEFGSDIPNNLFDVTLSAPGLIEASVNSAVSRWLPELSVVDVEVQDEETNNISVDVVYQIPESQVTGRTYSVRII